MLGKMIRMLVMFILEKIGLISNREFEENTEQKDKHFWEDESFWKSMAGKGESYEEDSFRNDHAGKDESFRSSKFSRFDTSNTVDGKWREVNEEDTNNDDPSESDAFEPESLQDYITELSRAADGIRHPKIREQAFHILILAKDIINEHDTGHSKSRNYGQFERYYIPTVTSVVSNYSSIESKGMATAKMQKDVLEYLESCGDAFTKMYNNMFSADITKMEVQMEAMDIIMKRDGLL